MDEQLKRRLIGATVLTSLAVIFLPMMFEGDPMIVENRKLAEIPPPPDERFQSDLIQNPVPVAAPEKQPEPVAQPDTSLQEPPAIESAPESPPPPSQPQPPPAPAPAPRKGLTAWVIQVGSFSDEKNAQELVRKLRKSGFDTLEPELVEIKGKSLYRVQVGPELEKNNADKLLPRVNKISHTRGVVVKYP